MANNIGTYFIVIFLAIVVLYTATFLGNEAVKTNSNIDTKSLEILEITYSDLNATYKASDLEVEQTNQSFEYLDAYIRQTAEDKAETNDNIGVINKITSMPDIVIKSLGVQEPSLLLLIKSLVGALIMFFLGLASYKAIRTGEVD